MSTRENPLWAGLQAGATFCTIWFANSLALAAWVHSTERATLDWDAMFSRFALEQGGGSSRTRVHHVALRQMYLYLANE